MAPFWTPIDVSAARGGPSLQVDALAGTGSFLTWLPAPLLHSLGVNPERERDFENADRQVVRRFIAHAVIRVADRDITTLVGFGDESAPAILGEYTLAGLGLSADIEPGRLVPMPHFPAMAG